MSERLSLLSVRCYLGSDGLYRAFATLEREHDLQARAAAQSGARVTAAEAIREAITNAGYKDGE